MELLFEFLGEILFEGLGEIIKNKKISLWIRIPLFIIISLLYLGIMGLLLFIGIKALKNNFIMGILLIILGLILLVIYLIFIYKFYKGTLN